MDMITQTLAAFIGSIALAGCLTDPTLVNVPQPVTMDVLEDSSDDVGKPLAWVQPSIRTAPNASAAPPKYLTLAVFAQADPLQVPQTPTLTLNPTSTRTLWRNFPERTPPMTVSRSA